MKQFNVHAIFIMIAILGIAICIYYYNVYYTTSKEGVWAVFCGVGRDELILAKNETLIRIPASDVFKVADYGLEHAIETLRHIRTKMDIDKYPLTPLKGNKNVKKTRN